MTRSHSAFRSNPNLVAKGRVHNSYHAVAVALLDHMPTALTNMASHLECPSTGLEITEQWSGSLILGIDRLLLCLNAGTYHLLIIGLWEVSQFLWLYKAFTHNYISQK